MFCAFYLTLIFTTYTLKGQTEILDKQLQSISSKYGTDSLKFRPLDDNNSQKNLLPTSNQPSINSLSNNSKINKSSTDILSKVEQYHELLSKERLRVYGQDSISNEEGNTLLFYATIDSEYRLVPGDIISMNTTVIESSNREMQVSRNGTDLISAYGSITFKSSIYNISL